MSPKVRRAEVARLAGVSESTVSRALNDSPMIRSEVKERVRRIAEEAGYCPSYTARQLAIGRSNSIGLVVPYYERILPFTRSYFPSLLDGILVGATEEAFNVGIVWDKRLGNYKNFSELIRSKTYDGLVFAVTPYRYGSIDTLIDDDLPLVLVNNFHEKVSSVYADPRPGMEKAFVHAEALGHRRIGYITGDLAYLNGQDRLQAFKDLAAERGMETTIVEGDFSLRSGYESFERFGGALGGEITLVMTASDRAAFGLVQACQERGMRVPDDLSVIGFDNFVAGFFVPPLTTVDHPITEMGSIAARILIDRIKGGTAGPARIRVDTDFVVRGSTAPARSVL